jgi:hypothetical protein
MGGGGYDEKEGKEIETRNTYKSETGKARVINYVVKHRAVNKCGGLDVYTHISLT